MAEQRYPFAHPILSNEEAVAYERTLLTTLAAERAAMQRAGHSLGKSLLADYNELQLSRDPSVVVLLIGKGHNGGDALIAAEILRSTVGSEIEFVVILSCDTDALKPLTLEALARLRRECFRLTVCERPSPKELSALLRSLPSVDILIDGLLGMSFRPPLRDYESDLLGFWNDHPQVRMRVAVDLPSGLHEEFQVGEDTCFCAGFTYATGIVKKPLLHDESRTVTGRIRYLDIGFFDDLLKQTDGSHFVLSAQTLAPLQSWRSAGSEKRQFGKVLLWGGCQEMTGAILMSAEAALRSGAGLVTAVSESIHGVLRLPEVMWQQAETVEMARAYDVLVAGPGMGFRGPLCDQLPDMIRRHKGHLVLDADALTPELLDLASERQRQLGDSTSTVITPHLGEWRRIRPDDMTDDPDDFVRYCQERGFIGILKGSFTLLTAAGKSFHSPCGGPVLSRGGSGDILAGMIGSCLGQQGDALQAVAQALVWHGRAADALARDKGAQAVRTTELFDYFHQAFRAEPDEM